MHQKIWDQKYEIGSFFVNSQRKLGLFALLSILQDVAWAHASHLGHGYESVLEKKMGWVLTRQKIVMETWPSWGETVEIKTWLRPMQAPFVVREFEIYSNGKVIGAATTSWLLLDIETRRPLKRGVTELEADFRIDYRLPFDAPKIEMSKAMVDLTKFQVRNSDLDMNEHVNNTRYAQWVLDSIPLDWHQRFRLHEYEVNFIAETRANDVITIRKNPESGSGVEPFWAEFQGFREVDQKVVFSARLLVSTLDASSR